ncbi:LPS assembly protein LptD [Pseudomonas aeruginosa]|nr:LPS assembly protein LptD [Pseudomonas aeruginosa]
MTRSWGYLTPTLKYLYTKYDLDLDSQGKRTLTTYDQTFDSSQDRSLPLVKVDSGVVLRSRHYLCWCAIPANPGAKGDVPLRSVQGSGEHPSIRHQRTLLQL